MRVDGNVEIVSRVMDAFNRRDLEAMLALLDADVYFYPPNTASAVGRTMMYHGHDGMRHYFDDVRKVWTSLQLLPRSFYSEGECVVAVGTISGERDGQQVESPAAWAWKLRNGKAAWGRVYESADDAFNDAGMRTVAQDS
jgi:ketosteroid isomerase-like protein